MEKVTIEFKDGSQIEAEVNGNCYITDSKPEFPEDLSEVTIKGGDDTQILKDVGILKCAAVDNRYWFTFTFTSAYEKLEAQIMYTAAMTDTLMEE